MTEHRVTVIPRKRGSHPKTCALWCPNSGLPYRCMHDITREIATWSAHCKRWLPQVRLCHWHAIEYVTGKPVLEPSYEEKQADMRALGA